MAASRSDAGLFTAMGALRDFNEPAAGAARRRPCGVVPFIFGGPFGDHTGKLSSTQLESLVAAGAMPNGSCRFNVGNGFTRREVMQRQAHGNGRQQACQTQLQF